jgi:hypothetical protein
MLSDRNPGVYEQLLQYPHTEVELRSDIAKDVDRTFIEYRLFSNGNRGYGLGQLPLPPLLPHSTLLAPPLPSRYTVST